MTNIFPKFKINAITYLLFLTFVLTGHIKNIILIFLIVIVHELGHIFFLKLFKYEIESVEIFPFGGFTKSYKYINTPIKQDMFIYIGGVLFQFFLLVIFYFLEQNFFISNQTYNLFKTYNLSILVFNLLPIRPLDGGELFKLILESFCSYYKAQKIINFMSIVFLGIFLLINIKFNLNNYVIISFLLVKIYNLIKEEKVYLNKFFLERFMYVFPYHKIKNETKENLYLLKKDTYHYFYAQKRYISEKELLGRKFDINSHF